MVDWLTAMNDPRIGVYFNPAFNTGTYVGEVYGLDEANAAATNNDDVSQRGDAILAGDFPGIFFDAAQTHFLCAEAAERGWAGRRSTQQVTTMPRGRSASVVGSDRCRRDQRLSQADVAYDPCQ